MKNFKVTSLKGPIADELNGDKKLGTEFEVNGSENLARLLIDAAKHKLITPMIEALEKTGTASNEMFKIEVIEPAAPAGAAGSDATSDTGVKPNPNCDEEAQMRQARLIGEAMKSSGLLG